MNQIFQTWKNVFGNWRYSALAIVVAVLFYLLNVLITNWETIYDFHKSNGFIMAYNILFQLAIGFYSTVKLDAFIPLVIVSILFGLFFSLLAYKSFFNIKFKEKQKGLGIFATIGVFMGALAPGCTACGIGLASVLGLGAGALSFLPYGGIELSVIAILMLSYSTFRITKSMYECNIN